MPKPKVSPKSPKPRVSLECQPKVPNPESPWCVQPRVSLEPQSLPGVPNPVLLECPTQSLPRVFNPESPWSAQPECPTQSPQPRNPRVSLEALECPTQSLPGVFNPGVRNPTFSLKCPNPKFESRSQCPTPESRSAQAQSRAQPQSLSGVPYPDCPSPTADPEPKCPRSAQPRSLPAVPNLKYFSWNVQSRVFWGSAPESPCSA